MRTYNLILDDLTGEVAIVGKNGRSYRFDEIAAAEEAAERGDVDAAATLAAVDHGRDDRGRPITDPREHARAMLEQMMHDCPLCRDERARTGRPPEVIASGFVDADEDPAWWHGRRSRRRRRRHRGRR
jgi:hypothetical protein